MTRRGRPDENRGLALAGTRHDARMTWTAPQITRPEGSLVAGERELLEGYLAFHRTTLLAKCAGLTAGQLAERAAPPSNLSCWADPPPDQGGADLVPDPVRGANPSTPSSPPELGKDADFELIDASRAQQEYEGLVEEWQLADKAAAGRSLDDRFAFRDQEGSLRMIYLHLIGEYARHNGHADFVREHLDGHHRLLTS
jgi:hypothetical protein